jgi:hypothetical protein
MDLCYDRERIEQIVGGRVVYGLGADYVSVRVAGD